MHLLLLAVLAAAPSYLQLGSGIVYSDAPRPTFYVVAQPQGVEAIDATSGKVRWRNDGAFLPLTPRGELLLVSMRPSVKRPKPRLVALAASTGRPRFEVSVPARAGELLVSNNAPGTRFVVIAYRDRGEDFVAASSASCYAGGAALRFPPPCSSAQATLRIDWKAHRAIALELGTPKPVVERSDQALTRVQVGASIQNDGGDLVYQPRGAKPVVLLRREGHLMVWPAFSADAVTVAGIGQRAQSSAGKPSYDAAFFDTRTGAPLGTCAVDETPAPFIVRGKNVFYVWSRHVGALDLASCRRRYTHEVRDLEYHGSYPP